HLVRIRTGNEESVQYFHTEEELRAFSEANPDLGLFDADSTTDNSTPERSRSGPLRRARHVELHESRQVADLLRQLAHKGLNVAHYSAQDQPLFELLEGSGDSEKARPLFSIPEILAAVKEVGKRGIEIRRFKGLGEMNPQQLFATTMDPAKRKLLRIDLTDAIEAEEMFTTLMGEEVEPRRQFIED